MLKLATLETESTDTGGFGSEYSSAANEQDPDFYWPPSSIPNAFSAAANEQDLVFRWSFSTFPYFAELDALNATPIEPHVLTQVKLRRALDRWVEQTQYESSLGVIKSHPSYAEVIDLGRTALVELLERLSAGDARVQWFPALKALAHTDPVPPHLRGKIRDMATAWVDWGRQQGLV